MVYTGMKFLFYPPNFLGCVGNKEFICFCCICVLVESNKKRCCIVSVSYR